MQWHGERGRGDHDASRRNGRGEQPAGVRLELGADETRFLRGHMKDRVTDLSDVDRVLRDEFRRRPLETPTRIDAPRRTLAGTQTRWWRRPFLGLLAHPSSVTGSTSTVHSAPAGARSSKASGSLPRRMSCTRNAPARFAANAGAGPKTSASSLPAPRSPVTYVSTRFVTVST